MLPTEITTLPSLSEVKSRMRSFMSASLGRSALAFEELCDAAARDRHGDERDLPELEERHPDDREEPELLRSDPADQGGEAEFRQPVARCLEVVVTLSLLVIERCEQLS